MLTNNYQLRTLLIILCNILTVSLCIVSIILLHNTYTTFSHNVNVTYFNYYGILIYTFIVALCGIAIHIYKYIHNITQYNINEYTYINIVQIIQYTAQGCSIGILFITLISQSIFFNTNTHSVFRSQSTAILAGYIIIDVLLMCIQLCCIILATLHQWTQKHKIARNIVVICNTVLFVTSMVILLINRVDIALLVSTDDTSLQTNSLLLLDLMQYIACYISSIALFGIGMSLLVKGNERLHYHKIVIAYCVLSAAGSITLLVVSILTLQDNIISIRHRFTVNATAVANPILASVLMGIFIVSGSAATMLQAPQRSDLCVEAIDLLNISQGKLAYYTRLINQYGTSEPDSISGESALALMKAYQHNSVTGATVKILRIYRQDKPAQDIITNNNNNNNTKQKSIVSSKHSRHNSTDINVSYAAGVWSKLDIPHTPKSIGRTLSETPKLNTTTQSTSTHATPIPLSKNAQAKLDKKLKRKAAQKGIDINELKSQLYTDTAMDNKDIVIEIPDTDCTEAICIITQIDKYDLTTTLNGTFGRLIQKCFGAQSFTPLLCVRMSLIGFHWPFKQGIFYCSPTRRPVGRNAAVLRAISEYNQSLTRTQRSTMLLIPYHSRSNLVQSIAPAGYVPSVLPATHIIDLRAYHNSTLQEYFKSIKYQEQDKLFNQAGGKIQLVVEQWDNTVSDEIIQYWSQIANKRQHDGDSPVLFKPTVQFINDLAGMNTEYRSLMFLKIDDQIVASCVMFQFPNTLLTSDLQGLDYIKGKPVKAYFVMMSAVIDYALQHNYQFLEFGPTTPKPKLAIGCKSIPLTAGIYSNNALIHMGSKYMSSSFTKHHETTTTENTTTKVPH